MTRLAVAVASGAAIGQMPGATVPVFGVALFLAVLIDTWIRPDGRRIPVALALAVGVTLSRTAIQPCEYPAHGSRVELSGYFEAPTAGRGGAFHADDWTFCGAPDVRVVTRAHVDAGTETRVLGTWRESPYGGSVVASSVRTDADKQRDGSRMVRWRGRLLRRLDAMYGARAPLVAALVLARKEGISPETRDAFARSGTAHLLAISGFHVGVVAALALGLLRRFGARRRRAAQLAVCVTWLYVSLIGFPDAACRAALILTALAASRMRGSPPARWGALASAFLVLIVHDPARISMPGFQLSFAGAAGLVAGSRGVSDRLARAVHGRVPRAMTDAVAAGVCATLATLPVVLWHFERVSLVGIPATLALSPLVALLLPGALFSLALDAIHPELGAFVAGGVDVGLWLFQRCVELFAAPAWASVWLPKAWAPLGLVGAAGGYGLTSLARTRGGRWTTVVATAVAAIVAFPMVGSWTGRGTVEIVAIDVGQGDAVAVRSPRGRWMLVDAGPPAEGRIERDAAVTALEGRGVARIETLVLTHPDLDHFGGAAPVLDRFEVGSVLDPGYGAGKAGFVQVLETASRRRVPWFVARAGLRFELDGVWFEVLAPDDAPPPEGDANATSVVILVRFGAFEALLTGDAPVEVEREVLDRLPDALEVLKVGHHGSSTSTAEELLQRAHPRAALVSVGRGNRYGHPAPEVVARLEAHGVEVHRTDREGTVRVIGRADGRFRIESDRLRPR